jgi:hypothetical protein
VGLDRATSGASKIVKDAYLAETGRHLRDDIHGPVYGWGNVIASAGLFVQALCQHMQLARFLDHRSTMSARLINDALFPLTSETRLVVLMTAIETLWPAPQKSGSISLLANALETHLLSLGGDDGDREEVRKGIERIRTKSIGANCQDRIGGLLGPDRAAEFRRLYNARSRFAHDGSGRTLLHAEGDLADRLALDTLLAELRDRAGKMKVPAAC